MRRETRDKKKRQMTFVFNSPTPLGKLEGADIYVSDFVDYASFSDLVLEPNELLGVFKQEDKYEDNWQSDW